MAWVRIYIRGFPEPYGPRRSVHGETVCRVLAHSLESREMRPIVRTAVGAFAGELVEHQLIDRIALGDDCGACFELTKSASKYRIS